MANLERKSFDKPEETRSINKGKIEVVKLGDVTAMRVRFEPGWKWSECVKPVVGTETDTVNTPSVETGTVKDTITVPTVETEKKEVTVPKVEVKRPNE